MVAFRYFARGVICSAGAIDFVVYVFAELLPSPCQLSMDICIFVEPRGAAWTSKVAKNGMDI